MEKYTVPFNKKGAEKLNLSEYVKTDIATEGHSSKDEKVKAQTVCENGIKITHTVFSEALGGFEAGNYYTLDIGEIWNSDKASLRSACEAAAKTLKSLLKPFLPENGSVTAVCLGNRRITSDSFGPLVSEKLIVTRHIKTADPRLFQALGGRELSAICPGVTGDTGIEAYDLIRSAVSEIKPNVVICTDALVSRSLSRLATTLQMSDIGLSPGSGIGNRRKEISLKSLGLPVISIGVPTVVSSSTLVVEALEKSGITSLPSELRSVLDSGKSYFVSLKDSDSAVRAAAELTAKAINLAVLGIAEI